MNPIMRYKRSKTKIGIFGILTKSQKGSILDHLRNLNKISTPFSESALKMALTKIIVLPKTPYNSRTSEHFCNLKTDSQSPENLVEDD
jgi:hypothetical protein